MVMKILLTNDDGWRASGINKLFKFLSNRYEVTMIAPSGERSAISHSISLSKEVVFYRESDRIISVSGTPTDCVSLGIKRFLKDKPDLVISGINHGPNMGDDITYSGTVAGAMEGCILGVPSIAMSINSKGDFNFDVIDDYIVDIIEKFQQLSIPPKTFLNVNFPNIPSSEVKGTLVTNLGEHTYYDNIEISVDDGEKIVYLNKHADHTFEDIEGTDFWAVDKGYISITPITLDLTDYSNIQIFKETFNGE